MNDDELQWCYNAKTGEIFNYRVSGTLTDFPRGTFLAYGDYLTTGFKSKAEAEQWSTEYAPCHKCRGSSPGKPGDKCFRCGSLLSSAPRANHDSTLSP